jgi:hypothetical protein
MHLRHNSAILAACLFAITGLIIPASFDGAEAAGSIVGKNFKSNTAATAKGCDGTQSDPNFSDDCKTDSKNTKIDLDRKGHKVKKSKSRGR